MKLLFLIVLSCLISNYAKAQVNYKGVSYSNNAMAGDKTQVNLLSGPDLKAHVFAGYVPDTAHSERMFEHQLGINASAFISSVLRLTTPLSGSPYDFNYKILYRTDPEMSYFSLVGLRFGAGWFLNDNARSNPIAQTALTQSFRRSDLRAGIEAQKELSRFWTAYTGLDYIARNSTDEVRNSFVSGGVQRTAVTNVKDRASGAGAVLGVQFNATRNICLSTEVSYYFYTGNNDAYQDSGFPGSQVQWQHDKYTRSEITSPFFINFNFRF